jgi:hypothetical protein
LEANAVLGLYILISVVVALAINILFYRLVFRKKKRMRANTFSWLTNLAIILPFNYLLVVILVRDVETGSFGGAIGFGLFMMVVIPPLLWFVPSSFFTMIRAIYIAITKNKEREILESKIEETDLIEKDESVTISLD